MNTSVIPYVNSVFSSISYRVNDILIDVGDEWEGFNQLSIVLLTHVHFDHVYGLNRVIDLNPNVNIYTNESGREMLLNARKNLSFYHETPFTISDPSRIETIEDGFALEIGNGQTAKAIFTPGHNPSCITWVIEDAIFSGDSYIPGIQIVTNLPGGNKEQAKKSLDLIKEFSIKKTVYPGHNVVSVQALIG